MEVVSSSRNSSGWLTFNEFRLQSYESIILIGRRLLRNANSRVCVTCWGQSLWRFDFIVWKFFRGDVSKKILLYCHLTHGDILHAGTDEEAVWIHYYFVRSAQKVVYRATLCKLNVCLKGDVQSIAPWSTDSAAALCRERRLTKVLFFLIFYSNKSSYGQNNKVYKKIPFSVAPVKTNSRCRLTHNS